MKRVLQLQIIVILIGALMFGCSKSERRYKIGVSQCSEDDWRSKLNDEIEREMMFHNEIDVEIRSADDNSQKQIDDIDYFIKNGVDILIVAPNEANGLTPKIKEVYERGIPVVLFDRDINGETYTANIRVDNYRIGQMASEYAGNLVKGDVKVIEVRGLDGSTPADDRRSGFKHGADSIGRIDIIASACARWNKEDAKIVVDSMLAKHPEVNLIYAHNDRMAIGASESARAIGRDDIKIIGVDAAPEIGIQAVADGVIDATFLYPTEGQHIITRAIDIIEGRPFPRDEYLPVASAVDSSNAGILLLQNKQLIYETDKMKKLKKEVDVYWQKHSSQTAFLYAMIVIIVLLAGMVYIIWRWYYVAQQHRDQLQEKNRELEEQRDRQKILNEQLTKATNSKLVFYTNVSHDLRTPLTLIADPIEQILDKPDMEEERKNTLLQIAAKNAKILNRLINQLLDFRKYENGKLTLHPEEVDFGVEAREWVESFRSVASRRHIKLNIEIAEGEDYRLAIDKEKIERVIFNLLSNAFKHTPDNGHITFKSCIEDGKLRFSVIDDGVGIEEENLTKIFERFYQVDKVNPDGSGIGLALTKAFVELHTGTLTVKSQPGQGAEFTVTIPICHISEGTNSDSEERQEVSKSDEQKQEKVKGIFLEGAINEINALETTDNEGTLESESQEKPVMLIIDDNTDIRLMIKEQFRDRYQVISASNGEEGLRMSVKYVPDIIICDVMMPKMDGFECCRRIKGEVTTSHIPVLLLTACSLDEQRAEGYDSGADGYISKPFSYKVLESRVANLIENRKRFRGIYDNQLKTDTGVQADAEKKDAKMPVESSKAIKSVGGDIDSDFYRRFLELLEPQLGNSDLSVEEIAGQMGLGRTQFYRKIKSLTNYSPNELIRHIRLKKARRLLTSSEKSVSEIAYATGFSNPAYFTKCFRDAYGKTPSELREELSIKK